MKKILDRNFFEDPLLDTYLRSDTNNKVVLTDYAALEAYKGNALKNISKSIQILSNYPDQVIILKGTSKVVNLKYSLKGVQRRLEDVSQTNEFKKFCYGVRRAMEGDLELQSIIQKHGQAANNHLELMYADASRIVSSRSR